MAEHATLTDPNLHESRGVSSATVGQVAFATGTGTTEHRGITAADITDNSASHAALTDPYLHESKGVSTATIGQLPFATGTGTATHREIVIADISDLGISLATAGDVLTSDGLGGAAMQPPAYLPNTILQGSYYYEDVTTATTPIALTTPGTAYPLTNDAAGAGSITFPIPGLTSMWNSTLNEFIWNSGSVLSVGDTVDFRLDIEVTTTNPNTSVSVYIVGDIGGVDEVTIQLVPGQNFKEAGTYPLVRWMGLIMRNSAILSGTSKVYAVSDTTGATVQSIGWLLRASHINP